MMSLWFSAYKIGHFYFIFFFKMHNYLCVCYIWITVRNTKEYVHTERQTSLMRLLYDFMRKVAWLRNDLFVPRKNSVPDSRAQWTLRYEAIYVYVQVLDNFFKKNAIFFKTTASYWCLKIKMVGKSCLVCQLRTVGNGGGYFFLPGFAKKQRRQEWVKALQLSDYFLDENIKRRIFICYRHFKSEDIVTSGKLLKLKKCSVKIL